jgi:hypothetical protein
VNFGWIGESWSLFSANAGVWIITVLICGLVPGIVGGLVGAAVGASGRVAPPAFGTGPSALLPWILSGGLPLGANLLLRIFSLAWTAFFYGGVFRMAVKQVRGETIDISDVFAGGPTFIKFLILCLVFGISVSIGAVLCVFPAFIVAGLFLPLFAIAADGADIGDAISRSVDAMKADIWMAALFVFVMGLIYLVSLIPCFLGALVTIPMMWLISALAYRDMVGFSGGAPSGPYYGQGQAGVWPPPPGSPQPPSYPQ